MSKPRKLDKFYTKKKLLRVSYQLNETVPLSGFNGFLEPRQGRFIPRTIKTIQKTILAVDILRGDDIEEADFLKDDLDLPEGKIAVVGNPAFGKNASLAVKFFIARLNIEK